MLKNNSENTKINVKKEKREKKEGKVIKELKEEKLNKEEKKETEKDKEGKVDAKEGEERKELRLPKEEFDFQLEIVTTPARAPVLETRPMAATTTTARLEDSLEEVSVPEREERKKKKEETLYVPVHYGGGEIRYVKKIEEDFEEKQAQELRESVIRPIQREWREIRERERRIEPVQELRFEEIAKYERKYEKPEIREDGAGIEELKRKKDIIKKYYEIIH